MGRMCGDRPTLSREGVLDSSVHTSFPLRRRCQPHSLWKVHYISDDIDDALYF
jgi:hypothetical protein